VTKFENTKNYDRLPQRGDKNAGNTVPERQYDNIPAQNPQESASNNEYDTGIYDNIPAGFADKPYDNIPKKK